MQLCMQLYAAVRGARGLLQTAAAHCGYSRGAAVGRGISRLLAGVLLPRGCLWVPSPIEEPVVCFVPAYLIVKDLAR